MDITPAVQVMFDAFSFGLGIVFFAAVLFGFIRWGIKEMLG